MDCNRCGAPEGSKQHECPARGMKCVKGGQIGHYAECRRSSCRINHVAEEELYSAKEWDWTPDGITQYNRKSIHWVRTERTIHRSIQQR